MPISYFIPDWDDRVDPGYDFADDLHTAGRIPYLHDVYAHEIFAEPPYDGILLSRATLDASPNKRAAILEAGSVHRYLRLPTDGKHLVLGDCGAFTYWRESEPPYQTEEVLEYYQQLNFDLGVSIDHLIFTEIEADKDRRWQITLDNAEKFLRLHGSGTYTFTPVGVAQGWDPLSYQRAVEALVKMGYRYIALGGLVRSPTASVLQVLAAIHQVLPLHMQVHLFGVNRPEYADVFARLGVTSFDSASRLRRAWMDGRRNYFLGNESYTALRIPDVKSLVKKKSGLDVVEAERLERVALTAIRMYDCGRATAEETLQAITSYDNLVVGPEAYVRRDYQRTLQDQPWKQCPCTICRSIGVEVIIFRGNNRNRRRGFHNIWQLYQQLHSGEQQLITESQFALQLEFSLTGEIERQVPR